LLQAWSYRVETREFYLAPQVITEFQAGPLSCHSLPLGPG